MNFGASLILFYPNTISTFQSWFLIVSLSLSPLTLSLSPLTDFKGISIHWDHMTISLIGSPSPPMSSYCLAPFPAKSRPAVPARAPLHRPLRGTLLRSAPLLLDAGLDFPTSNPSSFIFLHAADRASTNRSNKPREALLQSLLGDPERLHESQKSQVGVSLLPESLFGLWVEDSHLFGPLKTNPTYFLGNRWKSLDQLLAEIQTSGCNFYCSVSSYVNTCTFLLAFWLKLCLFCSLEWPYVPFCMLINCVKFLGFGFIFLLFSYLLKVMTEKYFEQ